MDEIIGILSDWVQRVGVRNLIIGALVLIAVPLAIRGFVGLWRARRRAQVRRAYGVKGVTRNFRVKTTWKRREVGAYGLVFPQWRYSKRDGTRDLRRSSNGPLYGTCRLLVGRFVITHHSPQSMYALVKELRQAGVHIALSELEDAKRQRVRSSARARETSVTVDSIHRRFAPRPTDFEEFCADLFRAHGYRATVTQAARDGGIDIVLEQDGRRQIAECKCYAPSNVVGRPTLQKLVGANTVERAHGMVFITTSSYSADARRYAAEVGMRLIDGTELVRMCRRAWSDTPPALTSTADFELSAAEISAHCPADWPR